MARLKITDISMWSDLSPSHHVLLVAQVADVLGPEPHVKSASMCAAACTRRFRRMPSLEHELKLICIEIWASFFTSEYFQSPS